MGVRQKWDVIGRSGAAVASFLDMQSFFIKGNWICAITRHNAEPNIIILLTKKSSCWLWRQTVKPSFNDSIVLLVGQAAQYNVWSIWMWRNLVLFLFWFRSHARCGCSIVCLRCQVVQIKQVDFKVSNYRYKTFLVIVGQLPKEYSQEKAVSAASAKWKEVKGKPVVINLINL